jgi:hypothetical protein
MGRAREQGSFLHQEARSDAGRQIRHLGIMLNGGETSHLAVGTPSLAPAGGEIVRVWIDYDASSTTRLDRRIATSRDLLAMHRAVMRRPSARSGAAVSLVCPP